MKGYLLDIIFGSISGIMWVFVGNAVGNVIAFEPSGAQSVIVVWLIPALLIFLGYTNLPLYKKVHLRNWKTMLCSFALFSVVGFFGFAYLIYGFALVVVYNRVW